MSQTVVYVKEIPVKYHVDILVAGRSVGTDHAMQASIRVIPGCYITGQAAVCVETESSVRDAEITKIQQLLK